jgi:hypothetical protein
MEIPFSLSTDEVRYSGAVLGKNGKIYLVPCLAKTLAVFDPSTGVISAVDSTFFDPSTSSCSFVGGVLGPDNCIYLVPYNLDFIGKLETGNQEPAYKVDGGIPESWSALLSPYFNKY